MESSDEGEFEVVSTGDFAKAEDEIKYLKSIVQELESRNREQTITLENITDEVKIFTEEKEREVRDLKGDNHELNNQVSVLQEQNRSLKSQLHNAQRSNKPQSEANETNEEMRIRMAAELEVISITAKGAGKLLQLIGKTPTFDINDLQQRRIGQTSVEKWAEEHKRLWVLINELYEEKMELHEAIVLKDREIENLKAHLNEIQESYEKNEETLKKSLEYKIKHLEEEVNSLEEDNEDLRDQNSALKTAADKSTEVKQLEDEIGAISLKNDELTQQLLEKDEQITAGVKRQQTLEMQQLEEKIETLSNELEKAEKEKKLQEKEISDLKHSLEEADAEFDQSEANFLKEIAKLKSDWEAKDRELKEVKKQNLSLEKELTEADKDIDDLEDEIKKLKSAKNSDEKSQISKLEEQKVQLQTDFNTLQDDIFKINTDKNKLKDERDRLKTESTKLKAELDEALAEIERLKARLKQSDDNEKSLQQKLVVFSKTKAENEHLMERVDILEKEVKSNRADANEIAEKRKAIEELERKLKLYSQEKEENRALTQEIAVLKKENEHLIAKTLSMTFEVTDDKMKTLVFHGKEQTNELILKLYYVFKENLDKLRLIRPELANLKSEIWLDMNFDDKGRLFYLFRYNR
ncbi:uncharacterized protein LOC142357107 isoform X2 [Convolutriloba macropyga]|uniref:uncharacterized protein LOC142357107 isoform X2 n=1 Tax=Convolutriloba macropyga TaxID=536237 RepID=UPI003F51BE88